MPRGRRLAAQAAANALRTPTPAMNFSDDEDEDATINEAEHQEDERAETPQDDDDDADAGATPAADSEAANSPEASPPVVQPFPRKKRLGRPPKNRPPDWNMLPEDGSEGGTPLKRKRGRPAGGGFRGRPRGGPSHVTKVPIDKEGNMMEVINDEVDLPEDPEGEKKVDKNGNLQDGRDYRVRVFKIPGRGDRLYMLSTEPARCTGFRDSYLFFTKHMQLHKIIVDENEKHALIDAEVIPHSYKGRAIGVVTARSVFREFGARIIIGGRKIFDDYYVQAARDRGEVEGEVADPNDLLPPLGQPYNKNQYVAWHGASAVYHTGVPSVPIAGHKVGPVKKKVNITSSNWQFEHAQSASRFNSIIAADRRRNVDGIYDPHTNLMTFPQITQPTHARWEEVDDSTTAAAPATNGHVNGVNGTHHPTGSTSPTSKFGPVPPVVGRNYLVVDTRYESAPLPTLGLPGPDGRHMGGIGPAAGLPEVGEDVLAELPPECRAAFEGARAAERKWRAQFGTETRDGMRAELHIGFLGFPV